METGDKENYLRVIEAQASINGRFTQICRIDPRAGNGRFSYIFKALDQNTMQEVALKFYDPLCKGNTYRERCFEREAEILWRLKGKKDILQIVHPLDQFTRQVIDVASGITTPQNLGFFATELADSDMLDYIYSDEVTPSRNLEYFRTMVRSVQRIHNLKICHRDIKPENFFRIKKMVIHLGDFGTARILDGSMPALLDDYTAWRGDKRYTAPEQCVSIPDKPELLYVGDIYSLGAILFEMFTRQLLFPFIFDNIFHESLSEHFAFINKEKREMMLKQLVPDIAKSRQLPNISDFNNEIPDCIKNRIEQLYHGLASIDYNQRIKDFKIIFQELNICEILLTKEKEYMRLIKLRQQWFENRKKKLEKLYAIRRQNE
jgi:serine/threonine protein kinase